MGEQSLSRRLSAGWRARRSAREESIVEGDEGLSSFTPSRRQFYSRTLSRDLPLKTGGDSKRPGNRNSWDASTSSGSIPRTSAALGSTLSSQEPVSRIEIQRQNNATNNASLGVLNRIGSKEPFSTTSTFIPSGEAFGRVGGHFEQHKNNSNAQSASPAPGKEREEQITGKQSVQQLKDLMTELESVSDGQVTPERGKPNLISSGNRVSLNPPSSSKSCTSFQMPNQLISSSSSNPNIVFSITISSPRHRLLQNNSSDPSHLKTSSSNRINTIEEHPDAINSSRITSKVTSDTCSNKVTSDTCSNKATSDTCSNKVTSDTCSNKVTYDTCSNIESKNTFIPYNRTISNSSQKNIHLDASKTGNGTPHQNSAIAKVPDTSPLKINNSEKLNGFVKQVEKSNEYSKPTSSNETAPKITDTTKFSAELEHKKYLTVEPYKRGRSEDLKATIDIVNTSNSFKDAPRSSYRPYGKSKSRDITSTIEAASDKFTQLNSGTLKKISPFEAYRRSKSKELGSAIDIVNNMSDIRLKSPPPSEIITRSDSCMSQFEKAKTSFERKFDKAKSPPVEFEKLRSPPREFEKVKTPSHATEVQSKEVVDNTINLAKEQKDNTTTNTTATITATTDVQKDKEKQSNDPEKSKSVYKKITSKFSRSLSNLGEDKQESKHSKDAEEEPNEKDDKFKLKRPSIFMKTKVEKCSSKTSVSEIDSKEDDFDKNEKKTSKLSYALNKFLGRKVDESSNKIIKESSNFPKKSTSVAIMPDKLKKPPRFRTKKFSKSHENLNREDDAEDYEHGRAKSVMPESQRADKDSVLESSNKDMCNHVSQIEINLTSRIDNNTSTETDPKPKPVTAPATTNHIPSISSYGLSPALPSKLNGKVQQNLEESSGCNPTDSSSRKKLSGEFSEDESITPTTESGNDSAFSGLEDIKEVEDESVMDRITRKSYYSRFNEMKRKPKLRRIDSKESMDQQLAAAKARLLQDDENNLRNSRDSLNSSRTTPQRLVSISPPLLNESVTRRTFKGSLPRTISLPPEDGISLYNGIKSPPYSRQEETSRHIRQPSIDQNESSSFYRSSSITRDEIIPYRRQLSSNLEEPMNYKRLSSVGRDETPFYLRQSSVPREEQPAFRLPSVVRDETPTFRRLSAAMREDPQLRRSSMTREEQPTFRRLSTNYNENTDRRGSSVTKDEINRKRLSMPREENSGYHTLQYRKNQNDDQPSKRYSSYNRDLVGRQTDMKEKYNGSSPTSPCSSPSTSFPQRIPEAAEADGKDNYDKLEAFAVATAAGKAAGEAAAAAISSVENSQSIPTSPTSASDSAAVKSAREELTRRLTPLTRLSTMGSGESNIRPYRRTVTSGNLPIGQSNINKPSPFDRPSYRRTTTMDLPPMESRPRTSDRRIVQDQPRKYSGIRSTENGLDSPMITGNRSPYSSYGMPTSTYSPLHSPPSMNAILRRTSFYRY